MIKIKSIYIFIIMSTINSYAQGIKFQDIDPLAKLRNEPSFSALIPENLCKSKFPYQRRIQRNLRIEGKVQSFSVFAFTTQPFDELKESILIVDGGPGGLLAPKFADYITTQMYPGFNVIFFHTRGSGCSPLSSMDIQMDKFINSRSVVADMEGIRRTYGVNSWKAVVGYSYGTNTARSYANEFPSKIQTIILEGLDKTVHKNAKMIKSPETNQQTAAAENGTAKLTELMKLRYKSSENLKNYITEEKYNHFLATTFTEYLKTFSISYNYFFLGYWNSYLEYFNQYYNNKIPTYMNQFTFAAVMSLNYNGADESADPNILYILNQFLGVAVDAEFIKAIEDGCF